MVAMCRLSFQESLTGKFAVVSRFYAVPETDYMLCLMQIKQLARSIGKAVSGCTGLKILEIEESPKTPVLDPTDDEQAWSDDSQGTASTNCAAAPGPLATSFLKSEEELL